MEHHAFSIYTGACDQVDESSAKQAVSAVLRFLTRMGILRYTSHSGYIASVVVEQDLTSVCSDNAGIYRRYFKPGDEVKRGEVLADVISPDDGSVISQIHSPTEGTILFCLWTAFDHGRNPAFTGSSADFINRFNLEQEKTGKLWK